MAMNCCHKQYAKVCEILVCVDAPAPLHLGLYQRLRFGLLASSWLPSPVGIFLWSALHVMLLIVGGPAIWVLGLLSAFIFSSVLLFGGVSFLVLSLYVVFGLIVVAVDLISLLRRSIRFCRSSVGCLACHEPIVEWGGGNYGTGPYWKGFGSDMREMFWGVVPIGVPCMSGSLYKETKDRMLETWARWCEEVVHRHGAIAL